MTQREDVMRAALEYIAGFGHSPIRHAREALVEVDALPENDTDRVREGWAAYGPMAVRTEAAEARLAQLREILTGYITETDIGDALAILNPEEPA